MPANGLAAGGGWVRPVLPLRGRRPVGCSAGDGARNYRFQLFAGPDVGTGGSKAPTVDQPGLVEPQLTLTDLPPGTYAWRVTAIRFKNGKVTEKLGPPQTLQIGK